MSTQWIETNKNLFKNLLIVTSFLDELNKFNSVWVAIKFLRLLNGNAYFFPLKDCDLWGRCGHVKKIKCKHICGRLK